MTELERLCEEALYEEVQNMGDGKSIVRDVPTGRLLYKKVLDVYNLQVFAYLKEHRSRSVPKIESFREEDGKLVVIEELVQGRTLENLLEQAEDESRPEGRRQDEKSQEDAKRKKDPEKDSDNGSGVLPFNERIRILTEICDGLTFLHGAEPPIIHRDLKASNIMLTEDGVVKIIDYDAAKVYISGEEKDTVLMGTHGVAAPEQYGFAASDVRTDIFALGKLVDRMLPDNTDAARIVDKATHIDPKKRYTSAAQMRDQIIRIREHTAALDSCLERIIPGYDPRRKGQRMAARAAIAALCAAVLLTVAAGVWLIVVYPNRRQAAMQTELAAIQSQNTTEENLTYAFEHYLDKYPYDKMKEEEQKEFRSAVVRVLSHYNTEYYITTDLLDLFSQKCGGDAFTEPVRQYTAVEKNIGSNRFEEALETLQSMKASGTVDADERWADAIRRCRVKAESLEKSFEEKGAQTDAKRGLELYALLDSYADEDSAADETEKEDIRNAGDSYDRLFQSAVAKADELSRSGDADGFENAEKIYTMLEDFQTTDAAAEVDLAEKLNDNKYRNAQADLEADKVDSAYKLFTELEDYKDAQEKAAQCQYTKAEKHMEKEEYQAAIAAYELCPGYEDADDRLLEAKYRYCEANEDKPDETAYKYIEELTALGYPGADKVRSTMYTWHVEITNGLDLLMGSQQSSHIRVFLYGGDPDASTHIRLVTTDNVNGETVSWTSPETCSNGGHVDASYNANTFEYSIFEREHTIKAYADDGSLLGSWTGVFTKDFMQD